MTFTLTYTDNQNQFHSEIVDLPDQDPTTIDAYLIQTLGYSVGTYGIINEEGVS